MPKYEYIATENDVIEKKEIKDLVRSNFSFSARLRAKIKKNGLVRVNGKDLPVWTKAKLGDKVSIEVLEERSEFEPQNIPFGILFEDEDLLIINKPAGYIVHPTKGHPAGTIANGIAKYYIDTDQMCKIRFVNRLDMDTSGCMAIAKSGHVHAQLMKKVGGIESKANNVTHIVENNIKAQKMTKKYIALVKGELEKKEGTIDLPIGRPNMEKVQREVCSVEDGGKEAITRYKVQEVIDNPKVKYNYSLVELIIETGRTHQIRVHMSHLGNPVLGDWLYGGEAALLIDRQALHARELSFTHPITKNIIKVEAPIPEDISKLIL
ncbi:MAG: RluA family pseudouridine synthase [Anaerovoracaceae bacterium]